MTLAIAGLALIVAIAAFVIARRQGRQLAALTDMYWQLKYEHGELKASVSAPPDEAPPAQPSSFVPLSSVKRSRS